MKVSARIAGFVRQIGALPGPMRVALIVGWVGFGLLVVLVIVLASGSGKGGSESVLAETPTPVRTAKASPRQPTATATPVPTPTPPPTQPPTVAPVLITPPPTIAPVPTPIPIPAPTLDEAAVMNLTETALRTGELGEDAVVAFPYAGSWGVGCDSATWTGLRWEVVCSGQLFGCAQSGLVCVRDPLYPCLYEEPLAVLECG